LTVRRFPNAARVTIAYDNNNKVKRYVDALGDTVTFAYDTNFGGYYDRVRITGADLGVTTLLYDPYIDRLYSWTDPGGAQTLYAWSSGYLSGITDPRGKSYGLTFGLGNIFSNDGLYRLLQF